MHTTETFARTVSAMEAGTSPAADEAGKDLVATVKEEPQDDIKDYAETTMNELLGLYGYDKVSIQDTQHLNLDKYGTGDQSPTSSRDDTCTPPLSDQGNDTDDISSICSNPNETTLAAQHKNLVSALNSRHGNREGEKDSSTRIICSWCQKSGSKLFTLKSGNGHKAFCSELCFTQCRRASFKKNKVCDWCKHVRHTVNYVDFQDGEIQLQFCCEKCLNQYKMNIFCQETEEHLSQIQSQIRCPSTGSEDMAGVTPEDSTVNKQILITPDLWLQSQRKGGRGKHSEREHDATANGSNTSSRKTKVKSEAADSSRTDYSGSRRHAVTRRHRSHDQYDRLDHTNAERDEHSDSTNGDFAKERLRPKDRSRIIKTGDTRASTSPPNHTPNLLSSPHDSASISSPMLPPGPLHPHWFPPSHMLGSLAGAQLGPYFPMAPQAHPMFYSNMTPKVSSASRKGSRHSPHPPTSHEVADSRSAARDSHGETDILPSPADHPAAARIPFPMLLRGMPSMPGAPFGCPVLPPLPDRSANPNVPGTLPCTGPPVTMMLPFPVVLPVPIPIPVPIPLTKEQIMLGIQKLNGNNNNTVNSTCEGNSSSATSNSGQELIKETSGHSHETRDPSQMTGLSRCDSRASSASARSFTSLSKSPLPREITSTVTRSSSSPTAMEGVRNEEEQKSSQLRTINPIASPVISSDEAIDLSTDKSGQKASAHSSAVSYDTHSESNGQTVPVRGENCNSALPKIHIVNVKHEPPLSQELPLPKTNHPYNKRRGLILDAPFVPKRPRSPSPERRVYVRNPPRDIYELQARRRCVRAKLRSK
ncbi:sine oculis-binding protein homolog [Liolophura sinensis]|uniref:sine oculis-binding protein homolog n=1 Tax=Liolophura sinensis TaxID=3198878 RepID=UPI00315916CD